MKFSLQGLISSLVVFVAGFSLLSAWLALASRELPSLLVTGLVALVAMTTLFFLLAWGILRPIAKIKERLDQVKKGNYEVQVEGTFLEEIQELAQILNEAIRQIRKDRKGVEDAKATLEIRVRARTKELQELAESLEGKVQERTKELSDKVRELERFQKLAVGRELKMMELKKRIKALEAEQQKKTA